MRTDASIRKTLAGALGAGGGAIAVGLAGAVAWEMYQGVRWSHEEITHLRITVAESTARIQTLESELDRLRARFDALVYTDARGPR